MQIQTQSQTERLFLNAVSSPYSRRLYKIYLEKYLQIIGYRDLTQLLSMDHKQIENDMIEFIISSKENGMKCAAITNYIKPVLLLCKINDIVLNVTKINKFMPPNTRNKKSMAYSVEQVQKLMDVADERMRAVILILNSTGCRIGGLAGLKVGSCEQINDIYKITVYENEPEEYTVFCTSECRAKGIDPYLRMRERYGEVICKSSPLIREQFDKRDPFAAAHPHRVKETALTKKLTEMAEATGLRTRIALGKGQKAASQRKEIPICNGFRRRYSVQLVNSGLRTELRWLLEGHSLKANDSSYLKFTNDDLLNSYMLAHDNLLISQEVVLHRRVEKLEVEKSQFDKLEAEIEALKKRVG